MRAKRLLILLPFLAAPVAHAGDRVFCCEDATGHKVCGDPLPQACYNRAYREMSSGGITKRNVDAPMTADELARKLADDKARRDAEARAAERRRRDKALLESYGSVTEIEARRDTTLAAANQEIDNLRRRERELVDERKALGTRVAALKGKPVPARLAEDIGATDSELNALRGVITQKTREAETIRQRYDEDRTRYLELTAAASSTPR
ncbi:hypothetical protein GCM10025771_02240 [Niveibacterium umoris]|uniref:DUF4124 domain-containing protein n=1 Tax=Niveibacterium umoris TaxID=1193620 RepID=A0A840BNM5_9RHOO|nr:hypothetical protein [Niveibacterium umoris]MBB4014233.1 hypothetical protein [Niveibacterium umoris]